ncbi:MAG: DNA methyltransferase [Gemmatimonadota bacterium]|nr:DNA methyltransferase [Gemmatimonadota bacterium]
MIRFNKSQTALNAICPYFTMFPLDFPLKILSRYAEPHDWVLDPFCGRGTTNFAARLVGLESVGVDSSPVAAAITASKLVKTTTQEIIDEAKAILETPASVQQPKGEFWKWAYHIDTLKALCLFRSAFLQECSTPKRIALRGIVLGALHGPKRKTLQSYFSNQCPRTYAPKPDYATRFWKARSLKPASVDVLDIIERRANRYFSHLPPARGQIRLADSRKIEAVKTTCHKSKFDWIITSPPYYGMRTYIPDQWLRNWFVGGSPSVDYSNDNQVVHSGQTDFVKDLRIVWKNIAAISSNQAKLIIRFGGLNDRLVDPKHIIKKSLINSGWRITTIIKKEGDIYKGKRQADTFLVKKSKPIDEYIIWAKKH